MEPVDYHDTDLTLCPPYLLYTIRLEYLTGLLDHR